jgi:hypothetical protein
LWCSHTGNHPHEELAKFGYRWWLRKVENFKNPAIFWQLVGTNCLNMTIPEKNINPLKSSHFGTFFSQKTCVCVCSWFVFGHQVAKCRPKKTCASCVHHSIMVL